MPANPAPADFRSDTVTAPCARMREAMHAAEVGDDVYDEDPSVKKLEAQTAAMAGHAAGLFFPSGTQSNLAALLTHCARGDEYIVAQEAHTYKYEAGGAAVLGGIQPQPLDAQDNGELDLQHVARVIKQDDFHFAKTRLLALENTFAGKVMSLNYLRAARELARNNGLALHLDGARAFNAAVALGVALRDITALFDSVSLCLSKGLGAPVGSVLCADADFIARAKRWRKMLGGGMRQVGMLAAAGSFALENNVARLADDHALAVKLADGLNNISGVEVIGGRAQTNMVFIRIKDPEGFYRFAKQHGVLVGGRDPVRLVAHKQLNAQHVVRAIEVVADYVKQAG